MKLVLPRKLSTLVRARTSATYIVPEKHRQFSGEMRWPRRKLLIYLFYQ